MGCFLISTVVVLSIDSTTISPTLRLFLTTGVIGGLTTYSAFNFEVLRFCEEGAWVRAMAYLLATLIGCAILGTCGLACGRWLLSRPN